MEAICTMIIRGDLPPVGHKISLRAEAENKLVEFLEGHQYWVDSGTSALALAVVDAKLHFPEVQRPRVIIPGYCCPDLVAACVYAGVEPVAVDIEEDDPSYNFEHLRAQLDERVIAIIAINFMGIAERLEQLRALIQSLGLRTRLIEDNAQWFPVAKNDVPVESDYAIFSFGRGKPLSLMGGGLLFTQSPLLSASISHIEPADVASVQLSLKIRIYNYLLIPQLFLMLNRNPFVGMGGTEYSALKKIQAMDEFRLLRLTANFSLYVARKFELKIFYDNVVLKNGLQKLAALRTQRARQLLRYPLLCPDAVIRDDLLQKMRACGLGATPMYAAAIDQVAGVDGLVTVPRRLENAESFASRFMTLPMHSGVSIIYQNEIKALLDRHKS
ncbi:MAG TPA: DegT/DnrJ/EryC1/StrS family aminotransferase [Cellvibrio sp.]|nr:DegT/DnrJ/EryC1/StrS family aminotransferase [Cellvibrio sp.]